MNKERSILEKAISYLTLMIIGIIVTIILIFVKGDWWMYLIGGSFIAIGLIFFIIYLMKFREMNSLVKKYSTKEFRPSNLQEFFRKEYYCDLLNRDLEEASKYDIKAESLFNMGDKFIDVLIIYNDMKIEIGLDNENVYYLFEELEDDEYDLLKDNLNKMYQLTNLQIFKPSIFDKTVYGDNSDFKIKITDKNYSEAINIVGEFIDKKIELINKVLEIYEEYKDRL